MALTKERKVIIAVLGLAVGALVVDRFLLGSSVSGPAEARATQPAVATEPLAAVSSAATGLPAAEDDPGVAAQVALAERLDQIQQAGGFTLTDLPDAFSGLAGPESGEDDPEPQPQTEAREIETFQRTHRLMAVAASDRGQMAIINGRTVLVGQSVDGFKLLSVAERSVVLGKDAARVQLKIDPPPQSHPFQTSGRPARRDQSLQADASCAPAGPIHSGPGHQSTILWMRLPGGCRDGR